MARPWPEAWFTSTFARPRFGTSQTRNPNEADSTLVCHQFRYLAAVAANEALAEVLHQDLMATQPLAMTEDPLKPNNASNNHEEADL